MCFYYDGSTFEVPAQLGIYSVEKRHGLREEDVLTPKRTPPHLSWDILKKSLQTDSFGMYLSTFFLYIVKSRFLHGAQRF